MNDSEEQITFTRDYELSLPGTEKSFLLPIRDWQYVKELVNKRQWKSRLFSSCGSLSLGVAASAFVVVFTSPRIMVGGQQIDIVIISAVLAIATAIIGALCLYFGVDKEISTRSEVLRVMSHVEHSYFIDTIGIGGSPAVTSVPRERKLAKAKKPLIAHTYRWNQIGGGWRFQNDVISLHAADVSPRAYYLWNTEKCSYSEAFNLSFDLSFTDDRKTDFRVALFSTSSSQLMEKSDHLLIYLPWENGGYRVDTLIFGKTENILHESSRFVYQPGKVYQNKLVISGGILRVWVNDSLAVQINDPKINSFLNRQKWYWGFSTVYGNIEVRNLVLHS